MLLNSHISAYTRSLAEKVCGLVRSTRGTSQGEDKLGARDKILNTKVARRACAGQTFLQRTASGRRRCSEAGGGWRSPVRNQQRLDGKRWWSEDFKADQWCLMLTDNHFVSIGTRSSRVLLYRTAIVQIWPQLLVEVQL